MGAFLSPENTVNLTTVNQQSTAAGQGSLAFHAASSAVSIGSSGSVLKGVSLGRDATLNITSLDPVVAQASLQSLRDTSLLALNLSSINTTHALDTLQNLQSQNNALAQSAIASAGATALSAVPHNEAVVTQTDATKKIAIAAHIVFGVYLTVKLLKQ